MKLLLLGAPQLGGDCWHDDIAAEARVLGWDVDYRQVKGLPVDDAVQLAKDADLLLWARTHSHDPDGDAVAMLREIEERGTVTVGVHLDLYWTLPGREAQIGVRPWWSCQRIYTADGGPRDWVGKGVSHRWCPPAIGARNLGRKPAVGEYRCVFFGGYVSGIHGRHRDKLLKWARLRWGDEFGWYGEFRRPNRDLIRTRNRKRRTVRLGTRYGDEVSRIVSYADLVLGDSAGVAPEFRRSHDHYWSDRVPRMMGRGAVFAHPTTAGMAEQGFDAETMIPFDRFDFASIAARVDVMTEVERDEMRDAAVQLVRDRHLWRHRLTQIAADAGLS